MQEPFAATPYSPETVVIRIGGSLDFRSASDFKMVCQQQISRGAGRFVLDFSATGILDSTGLGAIFSLYRGLGARPGCVLIAAPSRPVETVLQLTRTFRIFRRYATVEAACEAQQGEDFHSAA